MFSWYDYILFTVMLSFSALIGIYFGCFGSKQSTTNEYLMGGKTMKVLPIAVSLVASHISGITLLALPADVYRYGAAYWLGAFSMVLLCVITIYVYLPVFFNLQITSTYEYLERRFDNRTRLFASFLYALSVFLYLPIVVYIPALAFSAGSLGYLLLDSFNVLFVASGINVHSITPVVCGICIFYTTIGGLKAVVWTDTLQFTVTIAAIATVFMLG
ncbi:SSF domain containing protein, partial [Asbolus verrucosus]